MLKRVTTTCMVLCLLLPALCASASAYSILWVSTSDHTDLVKDEEYEAASVVLFMAPGVDDYASASVECVDGLEILYEEPGPPEPINVEEAVSPDLIIVEDEAEDPPVEPEEIELEEPLYDEIQEP